MIESRGRCISHGYRVCFRYVRIVNVIVPSGTNKTFIFAGRNDAFRKPLNCPLATISRRFARVIYKRYIRNTYYIYFTYTRVIYLELIVIVYTYSFYVIFL